MGNQVYLFELDSVRKTDEEIIEGQKALYDEIAVNGNTVVLTYNQLVDSRGFFSLLKNNKYQDALISLFKNGRIKISQFGDVRSIAQYLYDSAAPERKFIYSALPFKYTQKHILALIRRSLKYSDLSECYEYYTGVRSDNELLSLFSEYDDKGSIINDSFVEQERKLGKTNQEIVLDLKEIIKNLYYLLSAVMKLSVMHDIYIRPKDVVEYKDCSFFRILNTSLEFDISTPLWKDAVTIIRDLKSFKEGINNRSSYHRDLLAYVDDSSNQHDSRCYAEMIIDICYNYACEMSICNISKHYDANEFKHNNGNYPTYKADLIERLKRGWNDGKNIDKRFLQIGKYQFSELKECNIDKIALEASRFCSYTKNKKKLSFPSKVIYGYEETIRKNRFTNKLRILTHILLQILVACICVNIAYFLEILFGEIQSLLGSSLSISSFIIILITLVVSEIFTNILSKIIPGFLSLSDALGSITRLISDGVLILFKRSSCYFRKKTKESWTEALNKETPIECIPSLSLKKYREEKKKNASLFSDIDDYPIYDIDQKGALKQLTMIHESSGIDFGVVYSSNYNTMMVDPIIRQNKIFPYERIHVTNNRSGVVIIPIINDRLVLLKQSRHATRSEEYSFPRGFTENYGSYSDNAERELVEEIGATLYKKPVPLGSVLPDSGLTANRAIVFYAEISSYTYSQKNNEGIKQILTLSKGEFEEQIAKGTISDGFTLSAYALLCAKNKI